jgi:hypothetical protein
MKNRKNHSIDRKTCPVPKSDARVIAYSSELVRVRVTLGRALRAGLTHRG